MALVMTQEGALRLWQWMLNLANTVPPTLHLFGLNYTPHETATLSTFAANEVTGDAGYAPVPLTPAKSIWSAAEIAAGADVSSTVVSWSLVGPTTIYGYYLSDDVLGVSLWGEQFAASFPYPTGGVFAVQLAAFLVNQAGVS